MCAFRERSELYCGMQCVYDVVVKSSRSLSHLLMSFLLVHPICHIFSCLQQQQVLWDRRSRSNYSFRQKRNWTLARRPRRLRDISRPAAVIRTGRYVGGAIDEIIQWRSSSLIVASTSYRTDWRQMRRDRQFLLKWVESVIQQAICVTSVPGILRESSLFIAANV